MSWTPPPPRWDTLAGKVLDSFFAAVHEAMPGYDQPLTIFGSAPIHLCLDEEFASADVDIMVLEGVEKLRHIAADAGLGLAGTVRTAFGVQICPPLLFNPTPHYLQRAHTEVRHGLAIIVPHCGTSSSRNSIVPAWKARKPSSQKIGVPFNACGN